MIWGIQDGDILLEGIRTEAFSNLFNELNGQNNTQELNEKNIKIEKIPTMVLYDIILCFSKSFIDNFFHIFHLDML